MAKMTEAEWRAFITAGTRTGQLATTRADGRPHVVPVWFVVDGDDLIFTTGETTVKGRNLQRDGRVAICVEDDAPPFDYVMIEGTAHLDHASPDLLRWATRIAARYMGEEQADAYGKRNAVPSEMLVRVRISHVIAKKDIAGW